MYDMFAPNNSALDVNNGIWNWRSFTHYSVSPRRELFGANITLKATSTGRLYHVLHVFIACLKQIHSEVASASFKINANDT